MKKISLLLSMGAVMLASCSSDEIVNNPAAGVDANEEAAISFNVRSKNMGRDYVSNGLEKERLEFAVWAYKGADKAAVTGASASADNDVMVKYLVGFSSTSDPTATSWIGYKPSTAPSWNMVDGGNEGYWYYDGLGSDQFTSGNFTGIASQTTAATSDVDKQFLKYWDIAAGNTYFFAGVPYADVTGFSESTWAMTFNTITPATGANFMYASVKKNNQAMITAGKDALNGRVDLAFKRLTSDIRLAFYSALPGYNVEVVNFQAAPAGQQGVVFLPTVQGAKGEYTTTGADYFAEAMPIVTFNVDDETGKFSETVTYDVTGITTPRLGTPFVFALGGFTKNGVASTQMGSSNAATDLLCSAWQPVLPADADNANCGFTLNVTLKLTAIGTNEVLYVRGARVHVASTYTQWAPNTRYTYIFKITPGVTGTTAPGDPDVLPTPTDPALYPIIFDQITVESMTEVNVDPEFNLN